MPLTAYSISREAELDVFQVLKGLLNCQVTPIFPNEISEQSKQFIRTDLQCPCCFANGAEIVRESKSKASGRPVRQPYFRFATHHPFCDHATNEGSNTVPENLVNFGSEKSFFTSVIRELVCKGIEQGILSQRLISNMRKWFFTQKVESQFIVTIDPMLPVWIKKLFQSTDNGFSTNPDVSEYLTSNIISIPGFNYKAQAKNLLIKRYHSVIDVLRKNRVWIINDETERKLSGLINRHQHQTVFDPTVLADKYETTQKLAKFITENYTPLKSVKLNTSAVSSVTALSALLLYASEWNIVEAISKFAYIATTTGPLNANLGNVMGLNPFHDFPIWRDLRLLQTLDLSIPETSDPIRELIELENAIRINLQ